MRLVLLVMLCSFITVPVFSQDTEPKTTMEPTTDKEFNYITVGYKIQLQAGLPMKSGYKFEDMGRYEVTDCVVEMKGLYRKGEEKPCAFMLVYTEIRQEPVYFCVPTPDASEQLWERYFKSLIPDLSNHQEKLRYMLYGATRLWMKQTQNAPSESTTK